MVFLPAAVTGQCGCLLFTATHSFSPLPERERNTVFQFCDAVPLVHNWMYKSQDKKLGWRQERDMGWSLLDDLVSFLLTVRRVLRESVSLCSHTPSLLSLL